MFPLRKYILLPVLFLFPGFVNAQLTEEELQLVDSLKRVTESNVHDTIRLMAYVDWDNLIYAYDTELDIELNRSIIEICDKGLQKTISTTREKEMYLRHKGRALNNTGLVLFDYGDYIGALKSIQESLEIAEGFGDSTKLGNALNNIGMIYDNMGMNEKALEYYDSSITFSDHGARSYGTYYNNAGLCFFNLNQYDTALVCYEKSLVYADSVNDYEGMGNTLSNIGLIHKNREEYSEAISCFNRSINSYKLGHSSAGTASALKNIGLCYLEMKDYAKTIDYCQRALTLATEENALLTQKESCKCLYHGYRRSGQTLPALENLEQFIFYRDSLESSAKKEELLKIDFQFNYARQHMQDSIAYATEYAVKDEIQRLKFEADLAREEKMQYILFAGIAVALILGGVSFRSYRLKKKDNEIIAQQKEEVESQKELVEEKNKEITDSINYAKRIQEAILPNRELFKKYLPESFILYKPKDIVAGDFYWLEETDDKIIFAVADCTGHGVPGAMVSVVCHNALNRSVKEFGLTAPEKILDKTRDLVIETFEKGELRNLGQKSDIIRDGMDIALCVLDKKTNRLDFAGANNGIYHLQGEQLNELAPDKQPIGKYADEKPFSAKHIQLQKGDLLYLYSDGYADQFGGTDGKKFKYKQLKELLLKNAHLALSQQQSALDASFEHWKGSLEQVDDVCLMGVRI